MIIGINIGCGMTPTSGWRNFDNSPGVKLASHPNLAKAMRWFGCINSKQMDYIRFCQQTSISWADAAVRIPIADGTADALYASHVLGYFNDRQARNFFREARRVFKAGGTTRLALPRSGETLTNSEDIGTAKPSYHVQGIRSRIRRILFGSGRHIWVYGSTALSALLTKNGFGGIIFVPAGETSITESGALDLCERENISIYLEATAL